MSAGEIGSHFHMTGENGAPGRTIEALKKAIPLLKAQGYEFRRIEEKYGTAGKSEID